MKYKYRYLSENIFLFTLSGFIPKILAFILIPIYTGYLSTADYGISDLIVTTVSLLVPIFTLDIQDAVMRYSLDEKYNNAQVFSAAINIIAKGTTTVSILVFLLSFLQIIKIEKMYLFFLVLMFALTSCNNMLSLFCRGIDQIKILTFGSILNSIVTLLANIVFLVCFKWGLIGFLIANSLGSIINIIFIFFCGKLWIYFTFHVNTSIKKDMIAFSWPLIFNVVAWWINSASDRYILAWMSGISISGIYAIAYKIPNLLAMFQGVFTQAWSISVIKEFDKNDSDGFIGNIYTLINGIMVLVCSLLLIFNIPIAYVMYSNHFFTAWKYVPPLLLAVVFNAMSLFIGSIFTATKDTKTLASSTVIGAIVNTVFNLILIYYFGAMGAAIATCIGYMSVLIMRHRILRKHIIMQIKIKRDILSYVILILQMFTSCLGMHYIMGQLIFSLVLVFLYKEEIKKIMVLVVERLRKGDC